MSRKIDPRTEGKPLDPKKGGKHAAVKKQLERDKQDAIDSLFDESDPTEVLGTTPAPKSDKTSKKAKKSSAKTAKPAKTDKVDKAAMKAKKAYRADLPADLPESAEPFEMWKAQYYFQGKWYWSAPRPTINAALAKNVYRYKRVQQINMWVDVATHRVIRPMTPEESDKFL